MNQERIYKVLLGPHISEKATIVAEGTQQVVFRVASDATKPEIRKAVEQLFKVKVENVTTMKVKGKTKRNRYGYSTKPTWKKAYVSVQPGQEIDFTTAD